MCLEIRNLGREFTCMYKEHHVCTRSTKVASWQIDMINMPPSPTTPQFGATQPGSIAILGRIATVETKQTCRVICQVAGFPAS